MAIPASTTLEQAAVPAKTYDAEWILNFAIRAPSATEGSLYLETCAYDSETKEINPAIKAPEIRTSDFWQIVAEVPEAAQAMGAVFAAIPPIREWIAAKEEESQ